MEIIRKEKNILKMNVYYEKLFNKFNEWKNDASEVLSREARLFGDEVTVDDDEVCKSFVVGDAQDENLDFDDFYVLTKQILELVFGGFAVVMKRLLYDHPEGGKYHGKEEDYLAEAKNVPTTNAQSERDFGMLDGIMKTMPRATGLAVEGLVICRTNKPQFWRYSLGEKELASTMELAKKVQAVSATRE